jgi:glycosyltransferase involved in cell wall biosynthesis
VVIPCYNEQDNIEPVTNRLESILQKYADYELIFIDDGSTDKTLSIIKLVKQKNPRIKYLALSRNFGQQNALKAGIDHATGDCLISLDADLQHPPELIDTLIQKWQEGYDIVYTIRKDSEIIPLWKRIADWIFYKFINIISTIDIPIGTADFRLLDKKVVAVLKDINEPFIFLRGIIAWMGFNQFAVEYIPQKRFSGATKYTFRKMVWLAITGITSFSIRPLHLATFLGLFLAFICVLYALYAIYMVLFSHQTVLGWASVIVSVLFIGSIQLIILGIIGEYLGKLFIASKKRPNYIIKETNCG